MTLQAQSERSFGSLESSTAFGFCPKSVLWVRKNAGCVRLCVCLHRAAFSALCVCCSYDHTVLHV